MTSTVKPLTKALSLFKHADFALVIQWINDGEPVNLTGWTFDAMVRQAYGDAQPAATFEVVVLDVANGYLEIRLTDAQTTALAFDTGVYDVRATLGTRTERILQGTVKVYSGATQA